MCTRHLNTQHKSTATNPKASADLMLAKSFDPIDDYSISALHETLADTIVWQ